LRTWKKFDGHPFAWGKYDCGKLIISHLREMGHRPAIGAEGSWKSLQGVRRFLARHGGTGGACLDGWGLMRIAPANVLLGDIVELPGEPPFGAFGVALDNGRGRLMGYHEEADGLCAMQGVQFLSAWRV
jgi:hypothetical protein